MKDKLIPTTIEQCARVAGYKQMCDPRPLHRRGGSWRVSWSYEKTNGVDEWSLIWIEESEDGSQIWGLHGYKGETDFKYKGESVSELRKLLGLAEEWDESNS